MKRLIPYALFSSALVALAFPFSALALTFDYFNQRGPNDQMPLCSVLEGRTFAELVGCVISIFNAVIPLLAVLAIIIFFWGVIRYIASSGGAKEHVEGRQFLLWGIIALFVLFSIWGIIRILKATFFP